MTTKLTLYDITILAVRQALIDNKHNQVKSAKALDISRGTLRKYMKLDGFTKKSESKAKPRTFYGIDTGECF